MIFLKLLDPEAIIDAAVISKIYYDNISINWISLQTKSNQNISITFSYLNYCKLMQDASLSNNYHK